ncbi:MAG: hypothetical protein ACLUVC_13680 [Longibaculum sp.]
MNRVNKKMVEKLYYDWCNEQESMSPEENKAWIQVQSFLSNVQSPLRMAQDDAINEFGATSERLGFVAGFETAVNLLLGGDDDE